MKRELLRLAHRILQFLYDDPFLDQEVRHVVYELRADITRSQGYLDQLHRRGSWWLWEWRAIGLIAHLVNANEETLEVLSEALAQEDHQWLGSFLVEAIAIMDPLRLVGLAIGLPDPTRKLVTQHLMIRWEADPWQLLFEPS